LKVLPGGRLRLIIGADFRSHRLGAVGLRQSLALCTDLRIQLDVVALASVGPREYARLRPAGCERSLADVDRTGVGLASEVGVLVARTLQPQVVRFTQ